MTDRVKNKGFHLGLSLFFFGLLIEWAQQADAEGDGFAAAGFGLDDAEKLGFSLKN